LGFGLKEEFSSIQNTKSKIRNRFHCGATVRDLHPASPFVRFLKKRHLEHIYKVEKELSSQVFN
jgi:hypothetical protein